MSRLNRDSTVVGRMNLTDIKKDNGIHFDKFN